MVSHVIDGETRLHDLGGISISYISYIPFEQLIVGYTTECRLEMIFFTWCIVKLYCYVNLSIACHILIVANYISHLGIKTISWSSLVGNMTKTPEFSDHIQLNYLFFTCENSCYLKETRYSKSALLITGNQMY